jgi:hypothetical protein
MNALAHYTLVLSRLSSTEGGEQVELRTRAKTLLNKLEEVDSDRAARYRDLGASSLTNEYATLTDRTKPSNTEEQRQRLYAGMHSPEFHLVMAIQGSFYLDLLNKTTITRQL